VKNAEHETLAVVIYESHVRERRESQSKFGAVIPSWLMLTAEERDKWRDKAKDTAAEIEGRWAREFQGDF